jgi:hypothetical protein
MVFNLLICHRKKLFSMCGFNKMLLVHGTRLLPKNLLSIATYWKIVCKKYKSGKYLQLTFANDCQYVCLHSHGGVCIFLTNIAFLTRARMTCPCWLIESSGKRVGNLNINLHATLSVLQSKKCSGLRVIYEIYLLIIFILRWHVWVFIMRHNYFPRAESS